MKYPIFLSDFDGTLVKADGTISKNTKRQIAAYREAGGIFAVCTGRGLNSILPRIKELGLERGLVVAFQGGVIAELGTGRLLRKQPFSSADTAELLRYFEETDEHIHIYTLTEFYCNKDDEALKEYEHICGVKAILPKEPLSEFSKRFGGEILKILVMNEPDRNRALFERCRERFGGRFFITRSSEYLTEALPLGSTKGEAVRFLSGYYGVPAERIAAIGDQLNDLAMLEAAGGRFAVENAADELKELAVVVPSNEEDGVAAALKIATEA